VKKIPETTSSGVSQTRYVVTPEEEADLDASLAEAAGGELATDEEVHAVWAKHGL
jgi:predicted transcriptional regulator